MVSPGLIDALLHSCQRGGFFYDFFDGDTKVLEAEIFQQETADLATFAEEIFNGKLHFLYSEWHSVYCFFQSEEALTMKGKKHTPRKFYI